MILNVFDIFEYYESSETRQVEVASVVYSMVTDASLPGDEAANCCLSLL